MTEVQERTNLPGSADMSAKFRPNAETERSTHPRRYCRSDEQEAAMSIAKKAGLIVGVISAAATLATTAEGGEGGGGKRFRSPYYVESPVYVVRPPPVYVAPPPVVYAPAPMYYDPVYVPPAPPSLNINIPLR